MLFHLAINEFFNFFFCTVDMIVVNQIETAGVGEGDNFGLNKSVGLGSGSAVRVKICWVTDLLLCEEIIVALAREFYII